MQNRTVSIGLDGAGEYNSGSGYRIDYLIYFKWKLHHLETFIYLHLQIGLECLFCHFKNICFFFASCWKQRNVFRLSIFNGICINVR